MVVVLVVVVVKNDDNDYGGGDGDDSGDGDGGGGGGGGGGGRRRSSSSSSSSSLLGDVVENHETLEAVRCAGQASNCALRDHKSPPSPLQPPCSVRFVSNVRLMFVNDVPGAD